MQTMTTVQNYKSAGTRNPGETIHFGQHFLNIESEGSITFANADFVAQSLTQIWEPQRAMGK